MSGPAAALAHRVAPTPVTRASPWRRSRRTPRQSRRDAIPPNKEWPPADVWQDFREAVGGEWVGHAMTLGPTGTVVPLPDKYVPDSFKEYGVGVNQWSTRATTDYAGDGGIDEVDSFSTTTKYLWPEAGCEFGKEDVALVRGDTDALMGGGQMGKMCVVDGDYAHGPLKLPPCEPGAEVKFQFGFSQRTPDPTDDQGPAGPIKLNPNPKPTTQLPKRRIRVEVTVEARPGEKRDWRLASVEVISESRKDSEIDPGSPEIAPKLGEDDIATGEWRAIQGVTFLTCESLLDDEAFDASFDDAPPSMTLAPSDSEKTDEQLDEEKMRTRVGQGKGRTGRGRVKKNGVKGTTDTLTDVVVPTVVKSEAELTAEKEAERCVYFYFLFHLILVCAIRLTTCFVLTAWRGTFEGVTDRLRRDSSWCPRGRWRRKGRSRRRTST